MQLEQGTLLHGCKYRIERFLGQGGFGITYLGEQISLGRKIAVKEFFMKDLCNRDKETSQVSVGSEGSREMVNRFREKFVKEARNIAKLKHPNIVCVIDVFEENGTAYYVMDYCEGGSLLALLMDKYPNGMPEGLAIKYIREVVSALDYIHKRNLNHLDVKPANIMLGEMGETVLIDFGLSKQYNAETGNQTSTTPVGISEGYAPMEQYRKGGVGVFSPEADIYSLGATLFTLVTGKTPPDAFVVNEEGLPSFSMSGTMRKAIEAAMKPRRADRPHSIPEWIGVTNNFKDIEIKSPSPNINNTEAQYQTDYQNNDDTVVKGVGAADNTTQVEKKSKPKTKGRILFISICIVCLVVAMILGGINLKKTSGNDTTPSDENNISSKETSGTLNGHEWVDLGLSVKWATCNVGASSPSDYGGYYAWGEATTKSRYDWDNYFECLDITDDSKGTYKVGGQTKITPSSGHDTARENWGSTWRMPTDAENEELCNKCKWKWITKNGHNGYTVTGPNGNSIFLPAAGWRDGSDTNDVGECGFYWDSTLTSFNFHARALSFDSYEHGTGGSYDRGCGRSVRPVTE